MGKPGDVACVITLCVITAAACAVTEASSASRVGLEEVVFARLVVEKSLCPSRVDLEGVWLLVVVEKESLPVGG